MERVRIVGCEPLITESNDQWLSGLSQVVHDAVEPALEMIEELIARSCGQDAHLVADPMSNSNP